MWLRRSVTWDGDPRKKPAPGTAVFDTACKLAPGLVGYWTMRGAGPFVFDESPFRNYGTASAASLIVPGVPGSQGLGRALSGSSQDIQAPHTTSLAPSVGLTIVARIFWRSSTEAYNSVLTNEVAANGYTLLLKSDQRMAVYVQGIGNIDPGTGTVAFNTWSQVATTVRSGSMRLFLNGVLDANNASAGSFSTAGLTTLRIGSSPFGSGRFLDAIVDYVAVWMRELSAGEIEWLYAEPWAMFRPTIARRQNLEALQASILTDVAVSGSLTTAIGMAGAIPVNVAASGPLTTAITMQGQVPTDVVVGPADLFVAKKARRLDACGSPIFADCESWITK